MRLSTILLAICLLRSVTAVAQSPNDGRIQGNAYLNTYFHISYRWASILQPFDTASLNLPSGSPYGNEFLLFSARQGEQPAGVVLVAEKLNAKTPHSPGIKNAADWMNRIMQFNPQQHVVIISKKHFTSSNGFDFDELDYTEDGYGYSSAMITPLGNFLLTFKCNAKSTSDLVKMTDSVAALQKTK
jgi:hypothetical protein